MFAGRRVFVALSLAVVALDSTAHAQVTTASIVRTVPSHRLARKLKPAQRSQVSAVPAGKLGARLEDETVLSVEQANIEEPQTQSQGSLGAALALLSTLSAVGALAWQRRNKNALSASGEMKPLLKTGVTQESQVGTLGDISFDGMVVNGKRIGLRQVFESAQLQLSGGKRVNLRDLFPKTNTPWKNPLALTAMSNLVLAFPAHAEAGKLFDFDLTLPIIAGEFLLLMAILDKTVFGPVGKTIDDRDELIRSQLAATGSSAGEIDELLAEKDALIKSARAEVSKQVAEMKSEIDAKIAAAAEKAKAEVDVEIASALKKLEDSKADSMKTIDVTSKELSDNIINKVIGA